MYSSYEFWDLALQDLILHCPSELRAGVVPMFDWRNWKLVDLWEISKDLPQLIEEMKKLEEQIKKEYDEMMVKIEEAMKKAEEIAANNPEKVKFILVQMDWDKETTAYDSFITEETDATETWLSGSPNGIVEIYVSNGSVTLKSTENESGVVRLRLSKPID